jgi:hypothetical protein
MSGPSFDDRLPILQLGALEVDRRNTSYVPDDFSSYFPPNSSQEWEYVWRNSEEDEPYTEAGKRCIAPLWIIVQRLNLLGWSERVAREFYEESKRRSEESLVRTRFHLPPVPSFDVLGTGIASLDVGRIPNLHEYKGRSSPWHDAALVAVEQDGGGVTTEHQPDPVEWYRSQIEKLDTATLIHLLAKNPSNRNLPVTWWAYHEVIYGYSGEDDYAEQIGAKSQDRVLVVTEGKSDTKIIQKSFSMLRPHLQDFFTFVDMSENYPFTGVGNLSNFYKGLQKIGVQNNVVVLFDNDAEGVAKFEDATRLSELPNIRPLKLPDLASMVDFPTIGPTGEHYADINGRAVSIECLLDLNWKSERKPTVRWTSYLKSTDTYQGELIDKSSYLKRFLALTNEQTPNYNSINLETLLDSISLVAQKMAEYRLLNEH